MITAAYQCGALRWQIYLGSALDVLRTLPAASVDACVTSPPYWGLRDYKVAGQLGLQQTPDEYVVALVAVFREVARVMKPTAAMWLNLGDSFVNAKGQAGGTDPKQPARRHGLRPQDVAVEGLKRKDLVGIPWMTAFALRSDGWWLRRDQIWSKPNPMPDSALDRTVSSHEYVFLLTRAERYYFDHVAIREPYSASTLQQFAAPAYSGQAPKDYAGTGAKNPSSVKSRIIAKAKDKQRGHSRKHAGFNERWDAMSKYEQQACGANSRSVWTIATGGSTIKHFAMMPRALARKLIVSACPPGGIVLDPFAGSGTTLIVALEENRNAIGIELNPEYHALARARCTSTVPLFATEASA